MALHTNRLSRSTSPYLRQHADNPVDWHEWSDEAFEKARREDKPVFLSVGYSTCHWCHVMAHESFEDEQVARVLNEHFVAIKVDREQLPDVDAQYMLATQAYYALSGQRRGGGWPNSVWLMADGRAFFAGTYFPKAQFVELLERLHEVWTNERERLSANADVLANYVKQLDELRGDEGVTLSREPVERVIEALGKYYDEEHGGFGGAPKFPPHGNLALLADEQRRRPDKRLLRMITGTLDAMARGGIHDHIGGGFHRYSTDERWFVPHFEKMLYDNAQLMGAYADGYQLTGDEKYRRVVAGIVEWLRREMSDAGGGFYSALDADSEGEEGKYYVWTREEIERVLGDDAEVFCNVYGIAAEGNWSEEATGHAAGTNIAYLTREVDGELMARLDAMRGKLLAVRMKRVPPHLDDKVLSGWNGLMIGALSRAGYVDEARRAAEFVLGTMRRTDGVLLRCYREGVASVAGYLDDYAYLTAGLLELHRTSGEAKWLAEAIRLADGMLERFGDSANGGFFYTSAEHDQRLARSRNPHAGGNTPSPNGVAASGLLKLGRLTGDPRKLEAARRTLEAFAGLVSEQPFGQEEILVALNDYFGEARGALSVGNGPVMVRVSLAEGLVHVGEEFGVDVEVTVMEPYHIYGSGSAVLSPTRVSVESADVEMVDVQYPAGEVLRGTVAIKAKLVAKVVGRANFVVVLAAQACDEGACLEPMVVRVGMGVDVAGGGGGGVGLS